ncbi:SMC-Scp complex subunit ScpB [Patescibacteria group bacterium]|nr:SMC-Scp complex subunit ScpB [Patescibacteria group bacterium]
MKPIEQKIEALLLYKNEPVRYEWLAKTLNISANEIKKIVADMQQNHYSDRGIQLVMNEDGVSLMTASIATPIIEKIIKSQEHKELSKQALETLAIIVYKKKVTKPEIDDIRGVNSIFILRNLLIRGLITKKQNLLDKRSPLYIPTHDLLSHLGISEVSAMPGFEDVQKKLNDLEDQFLEDQHDTEPIIVGEGE